MVVITMDNKKSIILGQKFGEWTVTANENALSVHCKCSCGAEKDVSRYTLLNGKSKSCGHSISQTVKDRLKKDLLRKSQELTGKQFGKWTVLEIRKGGKALCRCECGKIRKVRLTELLNGGSLSCGCARLQRRKQEDIDKSLSKGLEMVNALKKENLAATYFHKVSKNSKTGITGVNEWRDKKTGEIRYRAYITVNRKQIHLGLFYDIKNAAKARKTAEEKYFVPLQKKADNITKKFRKPRKPREDLPKEKVCKICGKTFIAKSILQKYCSEDCRLKGLRQAQYEWAKRTRNVVKRKCVLCGKEFVANYNQKCCSKECSAAKKRYDTAVYRYEHGLSKTKPDIHDYRPDGIRYIPLKNVKKAEKVVTQIQHTHKKICPMCDTEFLAKGRQTYCCKECKNAATRYVNIKSAYRAGVAHTEPRLEDYKKGGRLYITSRSINDGSANS